MATRRQYWLVFAAMKNVCSAHNILDGIGYSLQDIDPSNGNLLNEDFTKLVDNAIIGCNNVVSMETRIKNFVSKYGLQNAATAFTAVGYNAAEVRDDMIAIADEARYILSNVLTATNKSDLATLGQHVHNTVSPLVTPLNEWRL